MLRIYIVCFIFVFHNLCFAEVGIKLGILTKDDILNNKNKIEMNTNADIFNVSIGVLSDTSVLIKWRTNEENSINLKYGRTYPPEINYIDMKTDKEHNVILSNLKSGSKYYLEICGENNFDTNFRTSGLPMPELIDIKTMYNKKNVEHILIFNMKVRGTVYFWKNDNLLDSKFVELKDYKDIFNTEFKDLEYNSVYNMKFDGNDSFNRHFETEKLKFTTKENNIALNKKCEGTFNVKVSDMFEPKDSFAVINRVNDNSTNYFNGIATSENIDDTDQWAIIDFDEIYPLKLIMIFWRKLCYPIDYKVEISLDKSNWKTLYKSINAGNGFEMNSDSGDPMNVVMHSVNKESARYLRITAMRGKYWVKHKNWNYIQLNEVKVFPN